MISKEELERLAIVAEECAEVIQIINKIIRHGYENYHPNNPDVTNRELLGKELSDLIAVATLLTDTEVLEITDIPTTLRKKQKYLHYQDIGTYLEEFWYRE